MILFWDKRENSRPVDVWRLAFGVWRLALGLTRELNLTRGDVFSGNSTSKMRCFFREQYFQNSLEFRTFFSFKILEINLNLIGPAHLH